ncbi:MAG: hypothetical protein C0519_04670 [Hyphomicrobium sp.]|nr:hypothetical protein [Hyphomicrobium sp.]PPD08751.1 MAG: hypothetical protein CTY28_03715 [Hyphomicrobium sp.]
MADGGELNISPDYQRLFRWSEAQRSRFIESLLLEMPVPPIYVIEQDEGTYQLIDGLQRISSYLHLRGKLEASHLDPPVKKGDMLQLVDCDIVSELNGMTFDDFPTALQIRLKRAFIRMEVVKKETDPTFKYHMFKRLNTGGDTLSSQQVRNATIRLLDAKFPDFVIELSKTGPFEECTTYLTQERKLSAFDQELVVRFFAFKNRRHLFKHDVADFLTQYMEDVASEKQPFNYEMEKEVFEKTFAALCASLGEYAFSFANRAKTNLSAGFSIYHYEAVTIGLQAVLDRIDIQNPEQIALLEQALKQAKLDPGFITSTTGGGKNSPGPLTQRIEFIATRLIDAFP